VRATTTLVITHADTVPPRFEHIEVSPLVVSPNQDGRDDILTVSLRVDEAVAGEVWLHFGSQRWRLWEGWVQQGKTEVNWPPPDRAAPAVNQAIALPLPGPATVEVRVQDRAGNVTVHHQQIAIGEAGAPRATVRGVQIRPARVQAGDTLEVVVEVENTGPVTLRAAPPGPSTYAWGSDFRTAGYQAEAGTVRVGLDFSGNRSGVSYPFRWSLGHDLAPGERAIVRGSLRVTDDFPCEPVQVWVGLLHEGRGTLADRRGHTVVTRRQ